MSVTAAADSATATTSRNKTILAEWEAERERHRQWRAGLEAQDPKRAARLGELEATIGGGDKTEEEKTARSLAHHAERASTWCSRCRTEFKDGDVVYRKRAAQLFGDAGAMAIPGMACWKIEAICDECVQNNMHPSWREHRRQPIPCDGGCGVFVSHWQPWQQITTCSKRCSEIAARRRRQVDHERMCAVCEEPFTPKRSDARYCSSACRQDAYRKRKLGAA